MLNPIILFEKWYNDDKISFTITFIMFIFLFGLIIGRIIGEYEEMIFINSIINQTAHSDIQILKNDIGLFYIQPYNLNPNLSNLTNFTIIK